MQLFRNTSHEWIIVKVNVVEIESTPGHKYYLPESNSWVSAKDLQVGTKVLLSDGGFCEIERIIYKYYNTAQTTYNFEVADFHTYYVSENRVLVHNKGCGGEYKPLKDGDYRATINPGEIESPHAHIFKKSNNIGRIFLDESLDNSLKNNRGAMSFVKKHKQEIFELIKNFYGKR